jgi:hypothetical protein
MFIRDKSILSSERMLHKDHYHKGFGGNVSGSGSQISLNKHIILRNIWSKEQVL